MTPEEREAKRHPKWRVSREEEQEVLAIESRLPEQVKKDLERM